MCFHAGEKLTNVRQEQRLVMNLDQLINVLITITLIVMMVAIGLSVTLAELGGVATNWHLVTRAALANYVCVPTVTVGLLLLFRPHPMVAAGFLVLAVCPGAPFGPPFTAIAKGNVASAVGLMAILAGTSALVAPLMLRCLLGLVSESGSEQLEVDTARILGTLLVTQLLPLCLGLAVRHWYPMLAERLQRPTRVISKVLNLVVVGFILVAQGHLLAEVRPRGFIGMFVLLLASWAAGWLLGGPAIDERKTMTLTTSLRNVGVGLVIATGSFAGTPALAATLVYGLFAVVGTLLLALAWGQHDPTAESLDSVRRVDVA